MPTTYLFRIDMNKDNDAFFNKSKTSASYVYAGIMMGVGSSSDWIPDLIEVIITESNGIKLRLIELEAQESSARISSRKYLPESSVSILQTFCDYLERIIKDCRSRADSRENAFLELKTTLSGAKEIRVTSVGALRSTAAFVEELPLIDQPKNLSQTKTVEKILQEDSPSFQGILKLSGDRAATLGRAILILDAVIREQDHSDAKFKTWRAQDRSQPLKRLLKKNETSHPFLRAFIFKTNTGTTLDFEKILLECAVIWILNPEIVRDHINGFFPLAIGIAPNDRMPMVFEKARAFLSKTKRFARLTNPNGIGIYQPGVGASAPTLG